MPQDNAVVFKRKLSDAFIRSLTEPGKHADGEVPGLYLDAHSTPSGHSVHQHPAEIGRAHV